MGKEKFYYNTDTCKFEKVKKTNKEYFLNFIGLITLVLLTSIGLVSLYDAYFESLAESFYLKISSITQGSGKIVEEDSINLIIKDNDPSYVEFHVDKSIIPEKDGEAILTAFLQRPFDKEIKLGIDYERTQSTATFKVDWESDKGDLVTIPVGDTLVQIKISSIDDPDEDPNESLYIYLNNTTTDTPPSVNITFGAPVIVKIDIEDDEIGPVANDDDYTSSCVTEGNTNVFNAGNRLVPDSEKTLEQIVHGSVMGKNDGETTRVYTGNWASNYKSWRLIRY